MERNRDSRKTTVSSGPRMLRRIGNPSDSPEGELHDRARSIDREQSKQRRDRDGRFLKKTRVDDTAEEEGSAGVHLTNNRGIRTIRSSPAVIGAPDDEVIGAVVPRRTRSSLVRRVDAESSSGSEGDLGRRRTSPAMASSLSVGVDCPPSSPMKKMKSSVEKRVHESNSRSNPRPSSTTREDIELEVAEALFVLLQQSHPLKFGREVSIAADSHEMKKSAQAESDKGEAKAFSLQKEQSVKLSGETEVAGSRDDQHEEGRADGVKTPDGPEQSLSKVGSSDTRDNAEPTSTKREQIATVVEEERLHKDSTVVDGAQIARSRSDKHVINAAPEVTVVNVATDPEVSLQITNKMSATAHNDAPVATELQKEKEGSVNSNQSVSDGMGKTLPYLLSVKNTQWQNMMEQRNQSISSLPPLSSGIHGWPGVLPYTSYRSPPLQAVARSSTGIQAIPFKFSQPRNKRCVTHQCVAINIRNHQQQQMVNSLNLRLSDGGGVSAVSLYESQVSLNKPWVGTTQEGHFLASITSPSETDKNAASAFINSKGSHVLDLRKNPHQMQSDSFLHGPGFIFPFGTHQAAGIGPASLSGLPRSDSSESHATSVTSLGFNSPTFASKQAPPSSYMAMLQSSGYSVPITANNMPMPPSKGGQNFPAVPFFGSSQFNFSASHYQQSSQTAITSSHKQPPPPPPSSKPPTTSKSLQASQQPLQLSKSSATTRPSTEQHSLVHQYATDLLPFPFMNVASIPPPQMTMMGDKVEYMPPEMLSSSSSQSSAAAAFANSSSVLIPSMQWQQQQQPQLLHQLQAKKMARDKDLSPPNYVSNRRQHPENFPPATAGVTTSQPWEKASQSGSALAAKETTEAASPSPKTSPSCRKDAANMLGSGQLPEPKC